MTDLLFEYATALNGNIVTSSCDLSAVTSALPELRAAARDIGHDIEPIMLERRVTAWTDCDSMTPTPLLVVSDPLNGVEFVDGSPMVRVYRPHLTFPDHARTSSNGLNESTSYDSAHRAGETWSREYGFVAKVQTRLVAAWYPRSA